MSISVKELLYFGLLKGEFHWFIIINKHICHTEVSIVKHMEDCVCTETQNVTFEVELSHTGIDAYWTFKNQPLKAGPKYKIESKGKRYSLTIINAMKDEEGQYAFAAGEKTSSAKLTVSGMIFAIC